MFEPQSEFDPPMAQTKALACGITALLCSIVAEMSTTISKLHLRSILANSSIRLDCVKIRGKASHSRKITNRVENETSSLS